MRLKISFALFLFLVISLRCIGQSSYNKSQSHVSVGYGLFNIDIQKVKNDIQNMDPLGKQKAIQQGSTFSYDHQIIGPLFFKYEYAAGNAFGLGLNISYYDYVMSETYTLRYNNANLTYTSPEYRNEYIGKNFSIGMRFNYHMPGGQFFDPYIGIAAGYSSYIFQEKAYVENKISFRGKEQTLFPFYFGITIGARLDLTPWLGIYGEVGIDAWTLVQTGINFRFNQSADKPQAK